MKRWSRRIAALLVAAAALPAALAGVVLIPEDAPEWQASEWINGDPGTLAEHGGRVVLLHFFQMWCPACNEFTIPLFQRWTETYGERDDVLILGLHSVFEGHDVQTPAALEEYLRQRNITYPVGIDAYSEVDPVTPITMQIYETEGTPQVAIIDKHGKLRFFHFARFDPYVVEGLIDRLLKEIGPPPGRAKPVVHKPDPALSGRYRVTMSQTTKTCGRLIRPLTLDMELTVVGPEVRMRSRQGYAGMNDLNATYDPATRKFNTKAGRQVTDQGKNVNVKLTLQGVFKPDTTPAEFEYTFAFEKSGDSPDAACKIEGRGKGTKVDPNRQR